MGLSVVRKTRYRSTTRAKCSLPHNASQVSNLKSKEPSYLLQEASNRLSTTSKIYSPWTEAMKTISRIVGVFYWDLHLTIEKRWMQTRHCSSKDLYSEKTSRMKFMVDLKCSTQPKWLITHSCRLNSGNRVRLVKNMIAVFCSKILERLLACV